jgi:ribosomal protein L12E/L44/L45/RPP1/RPP2
MEKDEVAAAIAVVEQSLRSIDTWLLVFTALVAIGVAGELWFGLAHWLKERELRPLRETQAQLQERDLATLQNDTARLSAIASAEERAASAARDAARANEATERTRTENLALAAKIAPRLLNSQQQAEITRALSRFSGRIIRVESFILDTEAAIFGQQLITALMAAGVTVDDARMTRQAFGSIAVGIYVTGTDNELTDALFAALTSVGFHPRAQEAIPATAARMGPDVTAPAKVFIGVKPIAP